MAGPVEQGSSDISVFFILLSGLRGLTTEKDEPGEEKRIEVPFGADLFDKIAQRY
jgi:hypothetical protein